MSDDDVKNGDSGENNESGSDNEEQLDESADKEEGSDQEKIAGKGRKRGRSATKAKPAPASKKGKAAKPASKSPVPAKKGRQSTNEGIIETKGLPTGWSKQTVQRKGGATAGTYDVYIFNEKGQKFRSKTEVARYIDQNKLGLDINDFDFSRPGAKKVTPRVKVTVPVKRGKVTVKRKLGGGKSSDTEEKPEKTLGSRKRESRSPELSAHPPYDSGSENEKEETSEKETSPSPAKKAPAKKAQVARRGRAKKRN